MGQITGRRPYDIYYKKIAYNTWLTFWTINIDRLYIGLSSKKLCVRAFDTKGMKEFCKRHNLVFENKGEVK